MTYEGEHLLAGNLGHTFVIISFVFALLGCIAFFNASRNPENYLIWIKAARRFFWGHVLTSFTFIVIMFFLLVKHYYEYQYIWQYSSGDMNFRYLLVAFWGGQEGSFMLWIFWHLVLGSVLVFTSKKFEPQVMTIFCLVQAFLVSMLLGVYIGDFKLGSSPFALRRMVDENMGPIWSLIPDYMTFDDSLKTGKGLNVLLRNYWMTIHPPTLFLGFALTLVPFCYAIAGFWTKRLHEWIRPALPWTFLGIMVLGGGILMGGRWAYESLSFGGFWAWDPVENASFV
ncbi:MAG TPA: cytochrome c biogenesis protein CcsA, partial [Flavobacteriales bacterium]|nr:cytochrome c biogenesis protein CcsA [Flavobacteriales bacterium]